MLVKSPPSVVPLVVMLREPLMNHVTMGIMTLMMAVTLNVSSSLVMLVLTIHKAYQCVVQLVAMDKRHLMRNVMTII